MLLHRGLHVDHVRLDPGAPPSTLPAGAVVRVYAFVTEPPRLPIGALHVLFVEDDVVAVNKPAGISVQGTRASVVLSLETQLKELLQLRWLTPAHRLDRETSGVMLFAASPAAAHALCRQFERRQVEKHYLAWVAPPPPSASFTVEGYIYQESHPQHARYALSAAPRSDGRLSRTEFSCSSADIGQALEVLSRDPIARSRPPVLQRMRSRERANARKGAERSAHCQPALVRARPQTGRTHQIRIHLAAVGSPILGDRLYGTPAHAAAAARVLLHAHELIIRLPRDREPRTLSAPLPADFRAVGAGDGV
ncbi:MAG: RluA family pseudouridine synthase [Deltaproteobacteria bacterium]|nr:RluA family pseudouridine synthase [Deltaproteobacteria bacterium]